MNNKKEMILKKLKDEKNISDLQVFDLHLILNNEQNFYNSLKYAKDYKNKQTKKGNFDKVLFIQLLKNLIDFEMSKNYFFNYYSYNKKNVNVATRYKTAEILVNEIIND